MTDSLPGAWSDTAFIPSLDALKVLAALSNVPLSKILESAYALVERKCVTEGCWHASERGVILCNHCWHGACRPITGQNRADIEKAMAVLKAAKSETPT